jgi:ABC-2 type transport system permease protein
VLHEPRLLLLDEPTAGVDPQGAKREFWDEIHALSAEGLTVMVSTHYMDEAERCHDIAYIAYGKLMARGTAGRGDRPVGPDHLPRRGAGADRLGRELAKARAWPWPRRSGPPCTSAARTARRWRPPSPPIASRRWSGARSRPPGGRVHPADGGVEGQFPMSGPVFRPRILSLNRILAVLTKEFIQLTRDRLTYAMILVMPIVQLMLFGYAINSDPRDLPTAVLVQDHGPMARSTLAALANNGYFKIVREAASPEELDEAIARGEVQFALTIPADFTRRVVRGDDAQILVEADASDPAATGGAIAALANLPRTALVRDLVGRGGPALGPAVRGGDPPRYNPESHHRLQHRARPAGRDPVDDPGDDDLAGHDPRIRARHHGEPAGHAGQADRGDDRQAVALCGGRPDPDRGDPDPGAGAVRGADGGGWDALAAGVVLFILGSLSLGFLISTLARNQLQAVQMSFFYIMPSILLSGFMFPFRGMPAWAQALGSVIPVTHFLRVVRGSLLKGLGLRRPVD